jgi:hypothetical protein
MKSTTIDQIAEPIQGLLSSFFGFDRFASCPVKAPQPAKYQEYLKKAAASLIKNDSDWLEDFCDGCNECNRLAIWADPLGADCIRRDSVFDDDGVREYALEWMKEDEDDEEFEDEFRDKETGGDAA